MITHKTTLEPLGILCTATLITQVDVVNSQPIAGTLTGATGAAEVTQLPIVGPTNHDRYYTLGQTPVNTAKLTQHLQNYRGKQFLIQGFRSGFGLRYEGPRCFSEANNLRSATKT